jgi:hypothetical protein
MAAKWGRIAESPSPFPEDAALVLVLLGVQVKKCYDILAEMVPLPSGVVIKASDTEVRSV